MPARLAVLLALFGTAAAAAEPLQAPFAPRAPDAAAAARACAPAPAPVVRFSPVSKYGQGGPQRDQADAAAEALFEAEMKPIRAFSRDVVKAANDYHRTGRISAARCAAAHLAAWAGADALAGPESHTAWFKLATTLSGLSLAYLQVRPALDGGSADARAAEAWLNRRGHDVARYFEMLAKPRSSRNNHRAWAGLAAAAAAAASGDRALLAKGVESFRAAACQATPEGALPMEIERGRKALEYHLYALAALTTLAELGDRNGAPLHRECGGALERIARFTLAAISDPGRISALAGMQQEPPERYLTPSKLVFLEPWLARNRGREPEIASLLARRPFGLTDLGGDQTLLYGAPSR